MDPPVAFVVVRDVAASWATTDWSSSSMAVPGLLLQAAGPTDEGCRTIEVWESEAAWRGHQVEVGADTRAVVRSFEARGLVVGPCFPDALRLRSGAGPAGRPAAGP